MATNAVAPAVAPMPLSIGEDMADTFIGNVEADMQLAMHRRALAGAQQRLRTINADFARMVEELNANYSDTEETLVRLYFQACKKELLQCYLCVQPELARMPDGRRQIETLVDKGIEAALAGIVKPGDKKDGKGARPTRGRTAD